MSTSILEIIEKLPQSRKDKINKGAIKLIKEYKKLQDFRKDLGLTQKQVAETMRMSQVNISKLESREDMHLSTLKKYVEAIGCELEIIIKVPEGKSTNALELPQN